MQLSTAVHLIVLGLSVLAPAVTVEADFLSPGSFRNLSVREISVRQDCDDEFACRSNSFDNNNCEIQGVCSKVLECNGRQGFPSMEYPLVDWQSSQNGSEDTPGCSLVTGQPQNPPPVTFPLSESRTLLVNGSAAELSPCYTQRADPLNSSFSLVFWLRADCRNCSVLEVPQTSGESIHLRVVENSLCVNSDCLPGITKGQWKLVTLRTFMNQVAFFSGENRIHFPSAILDNVAISNLYIGSSEIIPMADTFELYDVRFYRDALTTGEMRQLITGIVDYTLDFVECKCPSAYPDLDASDSALCTDGSSTAARFNTTVHFNRPEVMLDVKTENRWASSETGIITLTLDLGRSFQIEVIRVIFTSVLPSRMESTFVSDSRDVQTQAFTCSGSECIIDLSTQDAPNTMDEYNQLRAETIKISMHRTGSNNIESFVISEIYISGRCDCHGNANSCSYGQTGGYDCLCDAGTNTRGATCDTCKLNFIKSSDNFGCPHACSCNSAGVANANDMCDQVNGLCKCKRHVQGPDCGTCKPFSYNLESSNPDGCSACNCNQTGSLSCSNTTGECQCKDNTVSDQCDQCSDDSYSFADGCKPCDCSTDGTLQKRTDCSITGQCYCKENVMGLKCNSCKPGYYDLSLTSVPGCKSCSCHPAGAEHQTCDSVTGQCSCRGDVITDLACSPVITSIDPIFGPENGGTLVTIRGQLFGNDSHSIKVFLGNDLQQVIERDDDVIIFSSLRHIGSGSSDSKTPSLSVEWAGNGNLMNTSFTFTYLPMPVFDASRNTQIITYQRGGCIVKVYGSNFRNVKYPRLEMTNLANPGRAAYAPCKHNSDHLFCFTPDLSSIQTSSGNTEYQMKVLLDGVSATRDIQVLPDPTVNDAGNVKFQYPFEDTVSLSGKNLLSSCPVAVYLGVVSCEIKHLSDTSIEFAPPVSPPAGSKKNTIEVHIGEMKLSVGNLEYLELYETTGFIIIVSSIGGAILLVLLIVIICCCCRFRRDHPPSSNTNKLSNGANNKKLVEVDNRPMNTYSELITLVDAPDAPVTINGYNSPIRMETVIREHKKGIVNTEAEDNILAEEFLPRVEPGIREEVKRCYVGTGHFVLGRTCLIRGQHTQVVDGNLQKNGAPVQKLTIKSVIGSLPEHELPAWATLALSECLRLRRFKHNHVLSIIGIGANQHQIHILYPKMVQGILKSLVSDTNKDFSVRQLLGFSQQVAEGIDFLASKDVTHKDVAARNCMIDEYSVVKLSDASFAWDLYPDEYVYDQSRERYLPIRWMAPESLLDGYYDMRTDVWSFAVLVWELLTRGCLPFHEVTESSGVSEYILQGYILGRPDTLSSDVYELLRSCWSSENESRPTIATVSRTLSEILEAEDDETYANAGDLASFEHQHSSGLAATPRQHNGGGNLYSTTKLSRV